MCYVTMPPLSFLHILIQLRRLHAFLPSPPVGTCFPSLSIKYLFLIPLPFPRPSRCLAPPPCSTAFHRHRVPQTAEQTEFLATIMIRLLRSLCRCRTGSACHRRAFLLSAEDVTVTSGEPVYSYLIMLSARYLCTPVLPLSLGSLPLLCGGRRESFLPFFFFRPSHSVELMSAPDPT